MSTITLDQLLKDVRAAWRFTPAAEAWLGVVLLLALVGVAMVSARSITVTVDGVEEAVQTHRRTLDKLLLDLGFEPEMLAYVSPPEAAPLYRGMRVTVDRPRPVQLFADGRDLRLQSWGTTVAEILTDAGVSFHPNDQALLDAEPIAWEEPLPSAVHALRPQTYDRGHAWDHIERRPVQLRVHRAIPIEVNDGGLAFTLRTTTETIGEALLQAGITLYLGDEVRPDLGSPVSTGQQIFIERSTPLTVQADGQTLKTRAKAETVGDVLASLDIGLAGMDRVSPALETPLYDDIEITVTRIREEIEVTEEIAPFETIYEADAALPIDTQTVLAPGAEGITRTRARVRYEDGQEVARVVEDTWTAQEPAQTRDCLWKLDRAEDGNCGWPVHHLLAQNSYAGNELQRVACRCLARQSLLWADLFGRSHARRNCGS